MARGRVIDRLIEIKTRQGGGSAFRPAREASMMRALVERHRGLAAARHGRGHLADHHFDFHLRSGALQRACRCVAAATPRCAIRRVFTSASPTPCVPHFGAGERDRRGGASRSAILACSPSTAAPAAGAWWTKLASAGRAQDHRAAAVRRARRSSRGHAGVRDREAVGRRDGARHRARVGHARSMAPRHPCTRCARSTPKRSARPPMGWGLRFLSPGRARSRRMQ